MPFPRNLRYIFRNYTLTRWSTLKWSQKSHLKLLDLFIMQRDHPSGNYRYHWLVQRTMNIRYNWPYVLDEPIVVRQIVLRSNVNLKIHYTIAILLHFLKPTLLSIDIFKWHFFQSFKKKHCATAKGPVDHVP